MTVAEVDGLLYLPEHRPDRVREAVRIGALSPGWRDSFRTMLERTEEAGPAGPTAAPQGPAWPGFRPLRVVRTKTESSTVLSLWLAAEDGSALPAAAPGQYLTLRLDTGTEEGEPAGAEGRAAPRPAALVRSYSLSGRPGDDDYRISVKREGVASTFLHTRVHVGDLLQAAAPRGTFTLAPGGAPLVLVSAGVGATPVLAMLRAVADRDPTRRVWWLHGARDGREHAFAAEVRQLLERLPNSRLLVCYSRPRPEDRQGTDFTHAGRIDAGTLASLELPTDAEAYLCGPAGFMDDLTDALVGLGLNADHVHREIFGATASLTPGIAAVATRPPHLPEGVPAGAGPAVTFARSGLTVRWGTGAGSTLLELAEACDVPVRWSCRTGVCHTCETGVFSGDVDYDPEPVEPPEEGTALICCSCPQDDIVLDL
jgi:ferredoxin-NADP reductase